MDIGKNIRQLRELKNLTQSYVSDRLNMSVGGYSKIESGQTDVSLSKIEQIAEVLDVDLNTILNFDAKSIFNQNNNSNSIITGTIKNQNINSSVLEKLDEIQKQINSIRKK